MKKEELIPIYLTKEEATLFVEFQKNFGLFKSILDAGVLDISFGKMTLNFASGILQNIVKEEMAYKRLV